MNQTKRLLNNFNKLDFVGYLFAFLSFVIFIHTFFYIDEVEIKKQSIYWFFISFVAALFPNIKQFKFKDIEIEFRDKIIQEVGEKIEKSTKNLEENLSQKLELDAKVFKSLQALSMREQILPEEAKDKRRESYQIWFNYLNNLDSEKKLEEQKKYSLLHLKNWDMKISNLKQMLSQVGFFNGIIDNEEFTVELAQSISEFQKQYELFPVDGTAGPVTINKLSQEIMKMKTDKR